MGYGGIMDEWGWGLHWCLVIELLALCVWQYEASFGTLIMAQLCVEVVSTLRMWPTRLDIEDS